MDRTYHLAGGFKPTLKRTADLDGPDFFPTPSWATHALIAHEPFVGEIWEPACGNGAMSRVLARTGNRVISSDLYDRGFGEVGHDFITTNRVFNNVVTLGVVRRCASGAGSMSSERQRLGPMLLVIAPLEINSAVARNQAEHPVHRYRP